MVFMMLDFYFLFDVGWGCCCKDFFFFGYCFGCGNDEMSGWDGSCWVREEVFGFWKSEVVVEEGDVVVVVRRVESRG